VERLKSDEMDEVTRLTLHGEMYGSCHLIGAFTCLRNANKITLVPVNCHETTYYRILRNIVEKFQFWLNGNKINGYYT